ncbi:hypothetical protein BKA58DRAFT_197014 [Alternaria rosae]|uniref:uncharacterized protein n=1 Tax=Alternaria rosae TaxID=1187941 RepID=UPI001E8CD8CD|nr:uncharacterized protein BKA58DRAFT_197014 [Alternaria rosae]KAH6868558.1 hypothetical protein BKA58DRAFT_197014 [Alternaria rosae]
MASPRTHTLDNLRTSLTALVILHHASVPYGGAGSWSYTSPRYYPNSSPALVLFNVTNQTFFMGSFFLVSAYFSSIAAKKKTRLQFVREKWRRLGVPTMVFCLVRGGLLRGVLAGRLRGEEWEVVGREVWEGIKSVRGVGGPVWYCATLLAFDAVFAGVLPGYFNHTESLTASEKVVSGSVSSEVKTSASSVVTRSTTSVVNPAEEPQSFRTTHVLATLTLISTSSFFIRLHYPVGRAFWPLFLQLAYVSQYVTYYTAGIYIHRSGRSLQNAISSSTLRIVGTITAFIASLSFFHIKSLLDTGLSFSEIVPLIFGGPNLLAFLYAFFNEFAGLSLASLLLKAFYNPRLAFLSKRWMVGAVDVAKYSYAAFLVHGPVVLDLQCWFGKKGWESMGAVASAVVVGALSVGESWVVGVVFKKGVEWMGWRGYL